MNIRYLVIPFLITLMVSTAVQTICEEQADKRWFFFGSTAKLDRVLTNVSFIKDFLLMHEDVLDTDKYQEVVKMIEEIYQAIGTISNTMQEYQDQLIAHDQNMVNSYHNMMAKADAILARLEETCCKCEENCCNCSCDMNALTDKLQDVEGKIDNISDTADEILVDFRATWTTLGEVCEASCDEGIFTSNDEVDDACISVIKWLKMIYAKVCDLS